MVDSTIASTNRWLRERCTGSRSRAASQLLPGPKRTIIINRFANHYACCSHAVLPMYPPNC